MKIQMNKIKITEDQVKLLKRYRIRRYVKKNLITGYQNDVEDRKVLQG